MFLSLDPDRLYELTYPEKAKKEDEMCRDTAGTMTESEHRSAEEIDTPVVEKQAYAPPNFDTVPSKNPRTNTEIISESIKENLTKDYPSSYPAVKAAFKRQIDYEILKSDRPMDMKMLDEIVEIAVDTLMSKRKTCRVNREDMPMGRVQNRLLQIDSDVMRYILDSLKRSTVEVKNVRSMLLTTLYNAPETI